MENKNFWICTNCGEIRPVDEIVTNYGWCAKCFDESYAEYIEEHAGPFEALPISQAQPESLHLQHPT